MAERLYAKLKYTKDQLFSMLDQLYSIPYESGDGIILTQSSSEAVVTTKMDTDGLYYWYINGEKTNIINSNGITAEIPTATANEDGYYYINNEKTNILVPSSKAIAIDPNYTGFLTYYTKTEVDDKISTFDTDINSLRQTKQNLLVAGNGITIDSETNTISANVSVPTKVSELENDTGYITLSDVHIPENLSAFVNDCDYVTMQNVKDYTNEAFDSKEKYVELTSGDINDILEDGKYRIAKAKNYPAKGTTGYLDVTTLNYMIRQVWTTPTDYSYRDGQFETVSTVHENEFYVNNVLQEIPEDNIIKLYAGSKYTLSGYLNGTIQIIYPKGVEDDSGILDDTELHFYNLVINSATATKVINYPFTQHKLIIFLDKNSYNYILNKGVATASRNEDAVIYSEDDVYVEGYGGLSIESNLGNHGIKGNDVVIQGNPKLIFNVVHDAIHASQLAEVDYGEIYINNAYDGIQSKNESANNAYLRILGGQIYISNCSHGGLGTKTSGFVCNSLTKITFTSNTKNVLGTTDGLGEIKFLEDVVIDGDSDIQKTSFSDYFGPGAVYMATENDETGDYEYDPVTNLVEASGDTYIISDEKAIVLVKGYIDNKRILINGKSSDILLDNAYIYYNGDAPTIYYSVDSKKLAIKTINDSLNYVIQNSSTQPSGDCDAIKSENNLQFSSNGYLIASSTFGDAADGSDFTLKSDGAKYFINSGERGIKGTTLFIGADSDDVSEGTTDNSYLSVYAFGNNQDLEYADIYARNGKKTKGTYTIYNFMKGLVTCDSFKSVEGPTSVLREAVYAKEVDSISADIEIYAPIDLTNLSSRKMFVFNDWTVYESSINLSQKINDEVSRATAAESELSSKIDSIKTEIPVGGVNYFALTDISDADHSNRHSMMMKNDDSVSGYALKDNEAYNLVMVNKWDVADFGSRGLPINLNGSKERPTYNDDKEIALSDDLERMPLICTMPFRKVSGYLGDDGKKFSKETVLGWFGVSTIAELKELVIKKPIYLMYGITLTGNPMYYYIPCQYVSFTANNKLELITDGLDTNNNKLSRYKIVLTFVLNSEATVEDTEIDITVDNYLHLPELPADASTKTYVLKSVNGVMSWVEETQ